MVTGASKGIGASIALHLAQAGAGVVVNYSTSRKEAEKVVSDIEAQGGRAIAVQADVSKKAEIVRLFAEAKKAFGRIDILVNNAATYGSSFGLETITEDDFHRHFDLNVLGLLLCTQEAVKHMGPEGGNIVNISSVVSVMAPASNSVYSATKAAINAITRSLSKELGPRKIRVNGVAPSLVETDGTRRFGVEDPNHPMRLRIEATNALGRIGQPHEIAPVVVFLATEDAAWVTGETWFVTGGY